MPSSHRPPAQNLFRTLERPDRKPASLPASSNTDDAAVVRTARPHSALLPGTYKWAAMLPKSIVPYRLMILLPRIANRIASAWNDEAACLMILDDLLVDRNAWRQSFPGDVRDELLRLRHVRDHRRSVHKH